MSIIHTISPAVNPQKIKQGLDFRPTKTEAALFLTGILLAYITFGVFHLVMLTLPILGTVAAVKPESAGYFAFPKGLSDGEYVGKIATEPPATQSKMGRGKEFKLPAIVGVEVYNSTVVTRRYGRIGEGNTKRQAILNLSADSLGNLAFIAFNTPAYFPSMMTLTYPAEFSNEGKRVKDDLDNFLRWYKYHFPGQKYLWFLEFQRRGAPHFHLLSTVDLAEYGKLA